MLIFISRKCLRLYVVCCYSFEEGDDWGILDNEEVVVSMAPKSGVDRGLLVPKSIEKVPQYRGTGDLFGSRGVHRLDTHIVGV